MDFSLISALANCLVYLLVVFVVFANKKDSGNAGGTVPLVVQFNRVSKSMTSRLEI